MRSDISPKSEICCAQGLFGSLLAFHEWFLVCPHIGPKFEFFCGQGLFGMCFFHVTFCVSKILTFFVLRVYSEEQPGDAATALFIKQLSEEDAGQYR